MKFPGNATPFVFLSMQQPSCQNVQDFFSSGSFGNKSGDHTLETLPHGRAVLAVGGNRTIQDLRASSGLNVCSPSCWALSCHLHQCGEYRKDVDSTAEPDRGLCHRIT